MVLYKYRAAAFKTSKMMFIMVFWVNVCKWVVNRSLLPYQIRSCQIYLDVLVLLIKFFVPRELICRIQWYSYAGNRDKRIQPMMSSGDVMTSSVKHYGLQLPGVYLLLFYFCNYLFKLPLSPRIDLIVWQLSDSPQIPVKRHG